MSKQIAFGLAAALGMMLIGSHASTRVSAQGGGAPEATIASPIVFQAAGPTVASIQSMVDAFRAALGGVNNGNAPGPLADGRREINWDGGGSTATSAVPTPFDGFLVNRGGRFTTPGSGFVQAPVEGLAETFGDPSFAEMFQAFSPVRLFSAVGSNRTEARFFVPGGGELPAATNGFGAIFSDVDSQNPSARTSTTLSFVGVNGKVVHTAIVPASPGDASLSFLGVLFDEAVIAGVRIQAGRVAPGPNPKHDVVMMDDFIYGEPQMLEGQALQTLSESDADGR